MKQICILLCFFFALCAQISAQNSSNIPPATFFDPEQNPVAMRNDTSLQFVVSEYVLVKSVTTRLGQGSRVTKMYKSKWPNGMNCLVFEGNYFGDNQKGFSIGITLLPDANAKFYYASNEAMVCEKPGCNNCSISNGKCIGCCSTDSDGTASQSISVPLLKVPINID